MRKRMLFAARILAACLALGAVPGLLEWIFGAVNLSQLSREALHGAIYSCCIGIPCWLVLPRIACYTGDRPILSGIAISIVLLGVFAIAGCLAADLLLAAFHLVDRSRIVDEFRWSLRICLLITFTCGLITMVVTTLQTRLAEAREELHRRQVSEERERKTAAEARFASLESRVHPHFLFNTLNSISALVREDPPEAERMIERLSTLLRFSLDSGTAGVVALREELHIVREYLDIEKVRFGDRLRYRFEVDAESGSHPVPALSVQTLVENSVKYAVGVRREGAEIVIAARVRNGKLRVEVSDDGPGFEPACSPKPGHGLDLLERRLASMFGAGASLERSASEGRTMVAISLAA